MAGLPFDKGIQAPGAVKPVIAQSQEYIKKASGEDVSYVGSMPNENLDSSIGAGGMILLFCEKENNAPDTHARTRVIFFMIFFLVNNI